MSEADMIDFIVEHGLTIEHREQLPKDMRWLVRKASKHLAAGANLRWTLREADRVLRGEG